MDVWIMHMCIYESGVLITKATARMSRSYPESGPRDELLDDSGDDLSKPRPNTKGHTPSSPPILSPNPTKLHTDQLSLVS